MVQAQAVHQVASAWVSSMAMTDAVPDGERMVSGPGLLQCQHRILSSYEGVVVLVIVHLGERTPNGRGYLFGLDLFYQQ